MLPTVPLVSHTQRDALKNVVGAGTAVVRLSWGGHSSGQAELAWAQEIHLLSLPGSNSGEVARPRPKKRTSKERFCGT